MKPPLRYCEYHGLKMTAKVEQHFYYTESGRIFETKFKYSCPNFGIWPFGGCVLNCDDNYPRVYVRKS